MNPITKKEEGDLVLKMVALGFRKVIICSTLKVSERLVDSLKKSYGKEDIGRGRLKLAVSLLMTRSEKSEATSFMSIYLRIAKDPEKVADIREIITAYEIYLDMHHKFRPKHSNSSGLTIDANAAWILARDYRIEEIRMVICNYCGQYFISPYETRPKHKCPFCE
ncbi:FlhC family transcriptional regulator [Xenorhabdus sp. KJ12.1]|uniref:FlhC family transcriptional regulator n=1 Tax=Xenorhabdus sp. KJ12.1 TaxID=1851571 RepID=UPI000C0463C9|nr:FlhC family transcriptional regulator [Xenorhabdus sp. KJ12.1]PHM72220.1 flagellar biosynthesis transcription activator FlhC [Xenorhabdus sp. KJ12.1]